VAHRRHLREQDRRQIFEAVRPCAVIHLAALQVPFCKADPVAGAKVNVVGTVTCSSRAASRDRTHRLRELDRGLRRDGRGPWRHAHALRRVQHCDEQIAKVYSEDWNVASVGIRPGVVYGVAADQGLTSKTTFAILRRRRGQALRGAFFRGRIVAVRRGEVASAFIHAVSRERKGAPSST